MKTVIYIDELLLVNFAAAACFLLGAGLLSGQRCSGLRLALGAALAAGSALILLAPELPFGLSLLYKAGTGGAAVAAAYGWPGPRAFLQLCVWFWLLNLLLTGAAALPGLGAHSNNLAFYLDLSPGLLLACVGGVYLALRCILYCFGRAGGCSFPATLELDGAQIPVQAFYDTGFSVQDPASGRAVVLARYGAVRDALPAGLREYLSIHYKGGTDPPDPALGLRFVLCGTIAGRQLLPAVPAQALVRRQGGRTWRQSNLLVAFCGEEAPAGGWTLLLGADVAGHLGL